MSGFALSMFNYLYKFEMSLLILLSNVYFSIAKKIISHLQKIINEAS